MSLSERLNRFSLTKPDKKLRSKPGSKSPSGFKFGLSRSRKRGDGSPGVPTGGPSSTILGVDKGKSTLSATENLWARAEATLKSNPEKKKIFQDYLEILGQQLASKLEPCDGDARHKQLCSLIEVKTQELEEKKWKLQIGDWNRDVRDLLDKSFRSILAMKDLVRVAASACPPAALACAGATIILTLLVSAKDQESAVLGGLRTTSTIICRLPVMEKLYRSKANLDVLQPEESISFQQEFEATLTALYSQILEFQARAICYLRTFWITKTLKSVTGQDALKELLQDINKSEAQAQKFTSAIDAAEMRRWFNDQEEKQDKQNVWQRTTEHDKRVSKFLKSIYTCPYKDRKDDRNRDREPGTCEWFTTHPRFRNWNETQELGILWVSADPGSGKSILAKYLVDQVIPSTDTRTTGYFFFKDDFPDQKSSANAVCALLRQLFIEKPRLLDDAVLTKCERDGDKFTASFSDLWRIFIDAVADKDAGEIVCVLDALDECQESDRSTLISAIAELYSNGPKHRTLKFLCTSRPYGSIKREFRQLENRFPHIHLSGEDEVEVEKISHEIDLVVKSRVKDLGKDLELEADEISFLEDKLMANPQRTYLWVHLILDHIRNLPGFTRGKVERATGQLPQTVNEAYNKILNRSSDPLKAQKLLHAVVGAKRPLSLEEISVILAIEPFHKSFEDINKELEPEHRFRSTLRDLCGLFVVIIDRKIYLLHQTAREFLVGKFPLVDSQNSQLNWKESLRLEISSRFLAERCIWYLMSDLPKTPCTGLLDYSSNYWATHFREAGYSTEDEMTAQAMSLCDTESQNYQLWSKLYVVPSYFYTSRPTCLWAAISLDIEPVVMRLLKAGNVEMDQKYFDFMTPLGWAAGKGYDKIVKALLENGRGSINSKEKDYGEAPLHIAASKGREEVVRLLLEGEANVELKDAGGATPLSLAAKNGHTSVVKLLLERGKAAVNSEDYCGRTPLSLAAEKGHEAVVESLLSTGNADLEAKDKPLERTPLSVAALWGRDSVVKLLLEAGARFDQEGLNGETALLYAVESGHISVVDRLLKAGAELDVEDNFGTTPLSTAASRGREGVVNLLLKTGARIDSKDRRGWTPLANAVRHRKEEAVRILLDAGADPDARNHEGQTPLHWAVIDGDLRIRKMLLDAGADPDTRDHRGQTPLDWAIKEGRWEVAELLKTGQHGY